MATEVGMDGSMGAWERWSKAAVGKGHEPRSAGTSGGWHLQEAGSGNEIQPANSSILGPMPSRIVRRPVCCFTPPRL